MDSPVQQTSSPAGGTQRKLEAMTHDELLKHTRKHMVLLQRLKAKYDEVQAKLNAKADYDQLKEELRNVQQSVEAAEDNARESNKRSIALRDELECVQMKQETLVSSLQCLQEANGQLTQEKNELQIDHKSLQDKVASIRDGLAAESAKNEDMARQVADKSNQLDQLKAREKELMIKEVEISSKANTLENRNRQLEGELTAVKIVVESLKTKKAANMDSTESKKVGDLRDELSKSKAVEHQLQQRVTSLQESNAKHTQHLKILEVKCQELEAQLENTQKEAHDHQTKLVAVIKETESLKEFKSVAEDAQKEVVRLIESKTKLESFLRSQLQDAETQQESLRTENRHLGDSLDAMRSSQGDENEAHARRVLEYESILKENNMKINNLELNLRQESLKLAEVVEKLESNTMQPNETFNEQIRELQTALAESEHDLSISAEKRHAAENTNTELNFKIVQLQGEMNDADARVREFELEINAKQVEIGGLTAKLRASEEFGASSQNQTEVDDLRQQVSELSGQLLVKEELLDANRMEVELYKRSYDESCSQVDELKAQTKLLRDQVEHRQSMSASEDAVTMEKLSSELDLKGRECSALRDRACDLEEQLSAMRVTSDSNRLETEEVRERLTGELDRVQKALGEARSEVELRRVGSEERDSRLAQVEEERARLAAQLKEATNKLTRMETEHDEAAADDDKTAELETLQKNLSEQNAYNNKLKALAVKTKKEVTVTRQQLQAAQDENLRLLGKISSMEEQLQGTQTQATNVQMVQLECDKLQDQLDLKCEEKTELQKMLDDVTQQLVARTGEMEGLRSEIAQLTGDVQQKQSDNSELEKALSAAEITVSALEKEKEAIAKEKSSLKQEMDAVKIQNSSFLKTLEETENKLKESNAALKEAHKDAQHSDVMQMEIAQYERTVCELQREARDRDALAEQRAAEAAQLDDRVRQLVDERANLELMRVEAEERVTRTLEALESSRAEVSGLAEEELQLRKEADDCKQRAEQLHQLTEMQQLELSSKISECRELEEQIKTLEGAHTRTVDALERTVHGLKTDVENLRAEKRHLTAEYDSYKVRVHSVLKQQKQSKEAGAQQQQDAEDRQVNLSEITNLKRVVEQVQARLHQSQTVLAARDSELDLLQGDYDRLLRQQQQSSESAVEREGRWKSRVKSLQQEVAALRKQHADATDKLNEQNSRSSQARDAQLLVMRDDHEKLVKELRDQLEAKDDELRRARSEPRIARGPMQVASPRKPSVGGVGISNPSIGAAAGHQRHRSVDQQHAPVSYEDYYRSMTREEGEGEENPDSTSVVSFEQILEGPQIEAVKVLSESASVSSEVQVKQLEHKLAAQSKQLEHLSEVARENESASARLADQNRVLKDEIRRLERNQERERSVSNLEYLKNVFLKFVTLPPCDERRHLVPVIDTMLRLTAEERDNLTVVAQGEANEAAQQGWGSYLPRWSGM